MLAGASQHDVWVLTRSNNVRKLEQYLENHPLANRIRLHGIEGPAWAIKLKKLLGGQLGIQVYYDIWQRRARAEAHRLDTLVGFDLMHHVTFATYWARAGVAGVGKPFIWGPVGGGVHTPLSLMSVLGWRGVFRDVLRFVIHRLLEVRVKRVATSASIVVAQNPETARRIETLVPGVGKVRVSPNGVSAIPQPVDIPGKRNLEVVFVGSLVPLKAAILAVEALAETQSASVSLVVIGEGPERRRVMRQAERLGLGDRVTMTGHLPRREVLGRVAAATALIHPALHEESGMAVSEALALGTPVICLDWGGPKVVCAAFGTTGFHAISVKGGRKKVAAEMGAAIDAVIDNPPSPYGRVRSPVPSFAEVVLSLYDEVAQRAT